MKFLLARPQSIPNNGCGHPSYLHQGFDDYSGWALYAFNDAQFSESDFKAIRNIGKSSKQSDASKTGKSDWKLLIMDPHQRMLLGKDGERAFARRWNFVADASVRGYQGHVAWFGGSEHRCCFSAEFHGTMFRFPLRTAEHARYSDLSKLVWSPERMQEVLQQFQLECEPMLLFLKSVACRKLWGTLAGIEGKACKCRSLQP